MASLLPFGKQFMTTKNVKTVELNIKIVNAVFNKYVTVSGGLIKYKCLCCNKNYQKKFVENLRNQFVNKKAIF